MKLLNSLFLIFALVFLTNCTHSVHVVSFSDFRPYVQASKGTVVKSEASKKIILGFAFDTQYVDQAYTDLKNQCPNGTVSGISSQYLTSHGFFSWTDKIIMQGLCIN